MFLIFLGRIVVVEYTDSVGRSAYNKTLSLDRARAVKKWLVNNGITGPFETKGLGESKPAATNSTREGRRANRRVEFSCKKKSG